MGDLRSRGWIVAKGILFVALVAMSGVVVILHENRWLRAGLLLVCLWAACRFYYFLFHVLERYAGIEGRYAGLMDLCRRLWGRRKT